MIKRLYNIWKAKRLARAEAEAEALATLENEVTTEYTELLAITCDNILYLRGSINTLSALVNTMKGSSGAETKAKREFQRNQIEWYKRNLEEEETLKEHYLQYVKG